MPMSECQRFFQQHAAGGALSKEIQRIDAPTQLAWEAQAVSLHSPCAVGDHEQLARQVLDPAFFDAATGEVRPTLFEDVSSRGASTNRMMYTSEQQLHARGIDRATQSSAQSTHPKTYIGFVSLPVLDVRSIMADLDGTQRRAFGVYDTGQKTDPSHADICQLISDRAVARSVRSQLYQMAKGALCKPGTPKAP